MSRFTAEPPPSATSPSLAERFDDLLAAHHRDLAQRYPLCDQARMETLGIAGAGVMGTLIAADAASRGLNVILYDVNPALLASAPARVAAAAPGGSLSGRIETVADPAGLAAADLVLESVIEDAAIKGRLYAAIEPHLAPDRLLATNTSTLRIGPLSAGLVRPERFCGIHFFYPVTNRPAVEVIPGPRTAPAALSAAVAFARRIGRAPLVVGDRCGFVVNRLLQTYLGEGLQLAMEGVAPPAVDAAAEQFGMPWGPLRMLDEIGLDVALHCAWIFTGAFPDLVPATPLLPALVKARRLGRKSGAGFYAYDPQTPNSPPRPDAGADKVLAYWIAPARAMPADQIAARLMLPMLLEATRLLDDGTASHARDVDLGTVLGLGFPRARGGLLLWADHVGAGAIIESSASLADLGPRMVPTPMLRELAGVKGSFHGLPGGR